MTSRIARTEGLVLRNLRYGDTSRVATLFTVEFGKISVIGKGVRTPGSPFGASLELFACSEYVLYFRSGRDLQMLKSGDVLTIHGGLVRAPFRLAYGSAVLEFLDRMLLEEEPAPALYSLALRVLARLETERRSRAGELFRAFQLRAASLLGYALLLDACLQCGRLLSAEDSAASPSEPEIWLFRPADGGALCPDCARSAEFGHPLTLRALLRIRSMVRAELRLPNGPADGAGTVPDGTLGVGDPPANVRPEGAPRAAQGWREEAELRWADALEGIVEDFLRYHVDRYRGLRSLQRGAGRP